MTTFRYRARGFDGDIVEGELEAASAGALAAQLSADGITPVEIEEASPTAEGLDLKGLMRRKPVRVDELVMLARQLRALIRAGVPLTGALRGIVETTTNATLREALEVVAEDLNAGREFAIALERHPHVFPQLLVNAVRVGETTGRLEEAFEEAALYLERERVMVQQIRSVSRYPMMVIGAVGVAVGVVNVYVVPAFAKVFENAGHQLPLPTRMLIGLSDFTVTFGPGLVLLAIACAIAWKVWRNTPEGRLRWDRFRMDVPVIGPVIQRATMARIARGLALSSRSGIPIIQALSLLGRSLENAFVEQQCARISERLSAGEGLASSAARSGLFTSLMLQMIAVGEESGGMDDLLEEAAGYYETRVEYDLKKLAELAEPILIVVMGGVVLVLALAVYLPLWDMASLSKG